MKIIKKLPTTIILITLLALILRIFSLDVRDVWYDEAFSFFLAKNNLLDILSATASDNHPPLYYLVLHFWMMISQNEVFLRGLSAFFGAITIPLIYLIGKFHSRKVALWSAFILAVLPVHIYYSQEIRMYVLAIFLNLLITYYFLKLVDRKKRADLIFYIIFSILGLYTHYYLLFTYLSLNLIFLLRFWLSKKDFSLKSFVIENKAWVISQLVIILVFLPWAIMTLSSNHTPNWEYPILLAIPLSFAIMVVGGTGSVTLKTLLLDNTSEVIKFIIISLSFWASFLFVLSLGKLLLRNNFAQNLISKKYFFSYLAILLLILPFIFSVLASFFYYIFSPRSFIIFSPIYIISLAIGLESLRKIFWQRICLFILIFLCLVLNLYMHVSPAFWGVPLKILSSKPFINYQPGDIIAHASIYSYYPFRFYHKDTEDEYLVIDSSLSNNTTQKIGHMPISLDNLSGRYQRIWFVGIKYLSPPRDVHSLAQEMAKKYKLLSFSEQGNIEIYLFEAKK